MRQVITTKFLAPTETKSDRVKVSCEAGSKTFPWDYSISMEDNHIEAAIAMARFLNWETSFVVGSLGSGYVFTPSSNLNVG